MYAIILTDLNTNIKKNKEKLKFSKFGSFNVTVLASRCCNLNIDRPFN